MYNPRPGDTLYVDMNGQGFPMTSVAGTNWLTYTIPATIQNHINKFGVRNAYGQSSFWISRTGMATGGADAFTVTDFGAGNELWIVIDPSGLARAPALLTEAPKAVHVFNPWLLTAPMLSFSGGKRKGMRTVQEKCGWFMAFLLTPAEMSFFLEELNGADAYGAGGLGSRIPYDMSDEFARKGGTELFLDTDLNTWSVSSPDKRGPCGYVLAATVRDFSVSHPDFDFGVVTGGQVLTGMVQEILGPDRKPVRTADTSRFFNQFGDWFTSKPGVNAETCVDIPMSKSDNGMWRYESYDTPAHGFWPVDDFTTYDGAPNPHNEQAKPSCHLRPETGQWVTNGPPHNMNFCMESHATFIYQPGQKFELRGDDDVWVYINGKLVIDRGGIHAPMTDTIYMDQLGLTPGMEYNWDLFYCDRQPCGSSLGIKTSIYFKQQRALEAVEDPAGPGTYNIIKWTGGTGACGLTGGEGLPVPITGLIYELWNVTGTEKKSLAEGSNLGGGVVIATPKIVIDTSKILDLPPGNYRVIAYEAASPSVRAEIPFQVKSGVAIIRPVGRHDAKFRESRKPGRDALGRAKPAPRGPRFLKKPR